MPDQAFSLQFYDYAAFAAYFVVLCGIGLWVGRKEKTDSDDYFLAGRSLPWYVVGSSFVASNISSEHFIGMIGAAFMYGICVAMSEWANVATFSILIWIFIPFLLASRVFTTPEFMERRFSPILRHFFAIVTVISNVVAFLAAVLYGGGIALDKLFGWGLWNSIIVLGVVAGAWAIYGGLKSVAWTDFFTIVIMIIGGLMVTLLGLDMLSGDEHSLLVGWQRMIEANKANTGQWAEAVQSNIPNLAPGVEEYDRLSVIQPVTHATNPWPSLIMAIFSTSIWYNVINQFMIQRVLGAKNQYHARMGIVLAGYMKVLMPFIVVIPGLILFARYPEVLLQPWDKVKESADRGYVQMLHLVIPAGLRGLFLAALFGAIQSTVNSVLNSTATVFTLDIYKQLFKRDATEKNLVVTGMLSSVAILAISIVLAGFIKRFGGSLFVYIQVWYAFGAPPFAAIFILGILWRRINGTGAIWGVSLGFAFGIGMKVMFWLEPDILPWLKPYAMQSIVSWGVSMLGCMLISLMTQPPAPEQVTDQLTINWRKINILEGLGQHWYSHVVLWWGLFVLLIAGLMVVFSGAVL